MYMYGCPVTNIFSPVLLRPRVTTLKNEKLKKEKGIG